MRTALLAVAILTACAAPSGAPSPSARLTATASPVAGERVEPVGALQQARAAHTATLLSDGSVLIAGGYDGSCGIRSTEIFDPSRGASVPGPMLTTERCSHTASLLADGRLLVAGGWAGRAVLATTEVFDPRTGRFAAAAPMHDARAAHLAVTLADGRILVAGGNDGSAMRASAEIYDPSTNAWTRTGSLRVARVDATAVRLKDGSVLVAGGSERRGEILASAEIFDVARGQFVATANMTIARHKHGATLLPSGDVLVLGGSDARDGRGRYASTEIYDVRSRAFMPAADMGAQRFKIPDGVAALPSGDILVAGGAARPEVFDPARRAFRAVSGSLGAPLSFATATTLRDGSVLIAGGYDENIAVKTSLFLFRSR